MKRYIISIALVLVVAFVATARDRLYIKNFNIEAGETKQVPVLLVNETAYSGLQTDLYLPEGLSLDMEDDEFIIDLTQRKDNSHTVVSNRLSNGAIRIYVSSVSSRTFSGDSGAIMTLSITASRDFNGQAEISLKNTICAEAIGTRHQLDDETCYVNPIGGVRGDVNGDGEVNIADINVIVNIILGGRADPATMDRADVNDDGEVIIADINAIIDIILR